MRPNTAIAASAVVLIATVALIAACTGPTVDPVRSTSETSSEGTAQEPFTSRQTASPALTGTPASSPSRPKATQAPTSESRPDPTSTQTLPPAPAPADATPTAVMAQTQSSTPLTSSLPVYVQVVQNFLMPGTSPASSAIDLPANDVFAFDPASHTLLLRPSIALSREVQVLVGLTTVIEEVNFPQVHGQLYQVPPGDAGPVEVLAIDAEAEDITFVYAGQTLQLRPGESRSFKHAAAQATVITVITNTGRLASIAPFPYAPGTR